VCVDEPQQRTLPKLRSLTLSCLNIGDDKLFDFVKERRDHGFGLLKLVVRLCRVSDTRYRSKFGELMGNNVIVDSDDEETHDEPDTDELEFEYDRSGLRRYHELYGWRV